jgi:phosphatidylserine/phosphatidylglycerophosphate/cardiolipin synthase-like enzyme
VNDALTALNAAEMRSVASALRARRLAPPLSELALSRYVGRAADVSAVLSKLTDEGLSAEHLALFLEMLAAERERHTALDDVVELVSTGPEALGHPSRDTRIVVRELFSDANTSVLVAGYAVYQGRDVFQALADRMNVVSDLRVRMFLDVQRPYRDTSSASDILRRFSDRFRTQEWPGSRLPEVYYDPRALEVDAPKRASLHAKCVVADERIAFISSANFTEAAQIRNIEVGVIVRSAAFAQQLANYFIALADRRALERVPGL